MLLSYAMVITGISLLVWSADRFTDGAASIAKNFGVSPLIVGLTVVAMGSSAPEIIVSINAALNKTPGLAIGNAIGSNIANVALVLGVAAMVVPMQIQSDTLKREIPVLFLVTALALLLMWDLELRFIDGLLLLAALAAYLFWLTHSAIKTRVSKDMLLQEMIDELPDSMPTWKAILWVIIGLLLLQISSRILIKGAVDIAHFYQVSEFVIGVTIVAVGTSLPELAASVTSVLKGEHELAFGNVLGSNIFNLLAVMGTPALIVNFAFDASVLYIDFAIMTALSLLLVIMGWWKRQSPGKISRWEGAFLFSCFVGYQIYKLML